MELRIRGESPLCCGVRGCAVAFTPDAAQSLRCRGGARSRRMGKLIVWATVVAGTLDLLSAFVFGAMAGASPGVILHFVASGPLGDRALSGGAGWAVAGAATHYGLMACMAAAYAFIARRLSLLQRQPVIAGLGYGFVLWIIMYWVVRPLRWPAMPLPHGLWAISNALFSHCILVGLPIALITARWLRSEDHQAAAVARKL